MKTPRRILLLGAIALLHGADVVGAQVTQAPYNCTELIGCTAEEDPVCGDDYNIYPNACRLLLTHCEFPDAVGPFSIEMNDCLPQGGTLGFDEPDFDGISPPEDPAATDDASLSPTTGGTVVITDTAPHASSYIPTSSPSTAAPSNVPASSEPRVDSDESSSSGSSSSSADDESSEDDSVVDNVHGDASSSQDDDDTSHDLGENADDSYGQTSHSPHLGSGPDSGSSRYGDASRPPHPFVLSPGVEGFDQCAFLCPMFYAPVCTEDGHIYDNKCVYASAVCRDPSVADAKAEHCST